MSDFQVIFDPTAKAELQEAYDYYAARSDRAADGFLNAVDTAIDFIREYPLACAVLRGNLRHVMLRRYPYALYYRISGESILVVGCIHGKRHPRLWRSRA